MLSEKRKDLDYSSKSLNLLVGAQGFEPWTH